MIEKKLVVVGDGACGKTCLLLVFQRNKFSNRYIPTVFDTYPKTMHINGQEIVLSLYDTAGEEDYDRLRPLSYVGTNIVLICYAIDQLSSYENIPLKWSPEVKHFCPDAPIVLVANKEDLRNDPRTIEQLAKIRKKPVTTEMGKTLSAKIGAAAFLECSAKENKGVKEVFETAVLKSLEKERRKKKSLCVLI